MNKKLLQVIKSGRVDLFYKSRPWRKKRLQILERDNFECQKCKRKGKFSKATCVHHKKPLKEYPELALDDDNLESLCDYCHNEEHPEKWEKFKEKYIPKPKIDIPERW